MSKKKQKKKAQQAAMKFQMKKMERMQGMNGRNGGLMNGLAGMLPNGRAEQFLLGAALGAAVTYVLSDEELRSKLMKSGINLYTSLMGGVAVFKEQMADMQAEVEAERQETL